MSGYRKRCPNVPSHDPKFIYQKSELAGIVLAALRSRCSLIFLVGTASDDLQRVIRQRRCSAFASSNGARIQMSRSSSVVRITGIALAWIGKPLYFCGVSAL